jgi:serine/threonine protein kinase
LNAGCSASSVTFNLMGCSSPPLEVRVVHGQPTGFSFAKQPCTIVLSHAVQWGDQSYVFRGYFGGRPIVAKISSDRTDPAKSPLQEEYAVYQTLRDLQGSAIPRCYGLFRVGDFADMLLLQDCGESIQSYDGLTPYQRCVPCLRHAGIPLNDPRASLTSHVPNIHRRHVCHQDLEPRNIVMSTSGQLRVVDFELSDRFHKCVPHDCHELQGLAWETQGTALKDVPPLGSYTANSGDRHPWLLSAMVTGMSSMMVLIYFLLHNVLRVTN